MLRYAITDRLRLNYPTPEEALLRQATHLAASGIDYLQLREKDLPAAALAALARQLLAVLRAHHLSPKLLINSRADIAVATRADGVHLTSAPGSLTPAQVRHLYASAGLPEPIISLSCHTLNEVVAVAEIARTQAAPPSLIVFGPVFEKVARDPAGTQIGNKVDTRIIAPGTGLDILHSACLAAAPIPILALGGVTSANTPACLSAGAAGIAAIRLFLPSKLLSF